MNAPLPIQDDHRLQRAFTLIELLVVIAIIGILSAIVLTSINVARDKALYSHKIQTINQYRTALHSYEITNGSYPNENESTDQVCLGKNHPNSACVGTGIELTSTSSSDNPNVALESEFSGRPTPKNAIPDSISGLSYECANVGCSDYYLYWYTKENYCRMGVVDGTAGIYTKCRVDSSS